jgi:hypothetical protein
MLHFNHSLYSLLTHELHSTLVSQVVAPFNGVKGMILPRILDRGRRISQGGIDPSLSSDGVRPEGMNPGEDRYIAASPFGLKGCSQTRQPSANYQNIVSWKFHVRAKGTGFVTDTRG